MYFLPEQMQEKLLSIQRIGLILSFIVAITQVYLHVLLSNKVQYGHNGEPEIGILSDSHDLVRIVHIELLALYSVVLLFLMAMIHLTKVVLSSCLCHVTVKSSPGPRTHRVSRKLSWQDIILSIKPWLSFMGSFLYLLSGYLGYSFVCILMALAQSISC